MIAAADPLAPPLARALAAHDPALGLRTEIDADAAFVDALYAQTRWDELAAVAWPDEAKRAFLREQRALQRDHYRRHYANAEWLIAMREAEPIGRLYLHAGRAEIRLMDIALVAAERGRGIGGALIVALQREASRRGCSVTLHVEPDNPAQRLYARLGFSLNEHRGVYDFLEWRSGA